LHNNVGSSRREQGLVDRLGRKEPELTKTLSEEEETNKKLTKLAKDINVEALETEESE
jgi:hypothetical protein